MRLCSGQQVEFFCQESGLLDNVISLDLIKICRIHLVIDIQNGSFVPNAFVIINAIVPSHRNACCHQTRCLGSLSSQANFSKLKLKVDNLGYDEHSPLLWCAAWR